MRLWNDDLSKRELLRRVGGVEQVAGVRLVTLGDGIERGVRVLKFRTGTGFEVVVDRAFDIGRCELAGKAIGWQSGAVSGHGATDQRASLRTRTGVHSSHGRRQAPPYDRQLVDYIGRRPTWILDFGTN